MNNLQTELERNFPSLDIQLIGVNDVGFPSGNENITEGRTLPWVQDVDENGDGQSDVWVEWDIVYRDVAIVDRDNELLDTFNLTQFDLSQSTNYDTLKGLLTDAAATAPESLWQSPIEPLDINADGTITPLDALLVINQLDTYTLGQLPDSVASQAPYVDPTGDGIVAPLDALSVINQLSRNSAIPEAALSASVDFGSQDDSTIESTEIAIYGPSSFELELEESTDPDDLRSRTHQIVDEVFAHDA